VAQPGGGFLLARRSSRRVFSSAIEGLMACVRDYGNAILHFDQTYLHQLPEMIFVRRA
jgi:hypothetical protein